MFPSPQNSGPRISSLQDELAQLLRNASGPDFPKRLFWQLLSYDRVDDPVPPSVLPEEIRQNVVCATILARAENLFVCYLHLRAPELSPGVEAPFDERIARHYPTSLVLFSNLAQSEWDFCWRKVGNPRAPFRLLVDADEPAVQKMARRLAQLSAVDPATSKPFSVMELAKNLDQVFAVDSIKKRERRRHQPSTLDFYLCEINETKLLNADEEKLLASCIECGDSDSRDRLVRANLRLVVNIARNYVGRGLDFQDLIEEGNLGLLRAIEGFDFSMNTRFSTYASYWITQFVKRAIINMGSTIRVPAYMAELLTDWRRASASVQKELGRVPTEEEIASSLKLSKKKLAKVRKANLAKQASWPLQETVIDPDCKMPSMNMETTEDFRQMLDFLVRLPKREADILRMRFGVDNEGPKTLEEVGEIVGLTRERVRQIENEALTRLRTQMQVNT